MEIVKNADTEINLLLIVITNNSNDCSIFKTFNHNDHHFGTNERTIPSFGPTVTLLVGTVPLKKTMKKRLEIIKKNTRQEKQ